MGLRTTLFAPSPLLLIKNRDTKCTFRDSKVSVIVENTAAASPSTTNALVHGHGNMAPALTEPLSQTNKLSSSATSASPRPSSNNLLSESVSGAIADLPNSNHHNNNLANSNSIHLRSSPSFDISNSKTNHENILTSTSNTSKNGSFQSAFEEFQQSRKLQQKANPSESFPPKAKRRFYKNNKLSLGRRRRLSPVNGRVSNGQMGPMCDTNIKFEENNKHSIDSKEQEETEEFEEGHYLAEKRPRLSDQEEDDDVHTQHMDYSNCDDIENDSQDNVSTLEQRHNNNNKEQNDVKIDVTADNVLSSDSRSEQEEHQTLEIIQDPIHENIKSAQCDNPNQQIQTLEEVKQKTPPRTPPSNEAMAPNQHQSPNTTPVTSLTPQSSTPSGMGLQKDFIKDTAEMEQVLGELGTSDMDLLQVLKGFDTTPGGEGAFCELSLFTDVDVMNYEEVGMQQPKDAETKEVRNEIEKRQLQMQRKCDFLLRRLRKIQTRYMGKHTSEEIAGLFEWQANPTLRRKDPDATRSLSSSYEDDKRRQISTAAMKSFVRRINTAADQQHSSLAAKRNKVGRPSNASLQAELSGSTQNKVTPVVPSISEKMVEEIAHVSGHLHTELKEIQNTIDSDATASSSGGESADEMQQFNNTVQQTLSISKRAAWRWLRDRAAIASRWTWLLAQISDLEYRIRQHNELHHQIKKNKGAVTFEKCANELSSGITTPTTSPLPSSVNGYRGILPGNSKALDTDSPTSSTAGGIAPNGAYDSTTNYLLGSCRTRAFQRAGFRKRKLLQTANVHTVSKKAARPSTVKCGCQWPLHPCGLCTGRADPTAPRDLPDTMTPSERVALLDSGFHPVLSFPEDVSHSIHFEATMRLPEWQNRVIRCSSKPTSTSSLKGAVAVQKAAEREDRSKKFLDNRRKYTRKYPQDIIAANKLKNAKTRRSLHGDQYNNHLSKGKHRKLMSSSSVGGGGGGQLSGNATGLGSNNGGGGLSSATSSTAGSDSMGLIDSLDTSNGQLPRSKNASPTPGSHGNSSFKHERMDRRNRNSYDIDNIVIPYSVAAATRVEILPYKEIPTPKWRIIDDEYPDIVPNSSSESTEIEIKSENVANTDKIDSGVSGSDDINTSDEKSSTLESVADTSTSKIKENDNTTQLTEKPLPHNDKSVDGDHDVDADEDEIEDISDETFLIRHERALIDERKKFQTYLKYPWSTRSRANRRTDSRAESSGANTPDPSSPAPNTPSVGGDQESVPSPTAPLTPQTPLDAIDDNASSNQVTTATPNNQPFLITSSSAAKRIERKRTASGRKEREHSKDDSGGNITPDGKEIIPPYEPLEFPLSDDAYETMLELMPNDHQLLEDCLKSNICDGATSDITSHSGDCGEIVDSVKHSTSISNHQFPSTKAVVIGSGSSGVGSVISTGSTVQNNSGIINIDSSKVGISNQFQVELLAFGSNDNLIGEDSDTDSAESGMPDEDPNDPEWREPE